MFEINTYPEPVQLAFVDFQLRMADTNLVLGHRLSEWCGHGPILEQDIALSNIALDLLGQAQNWYQLAAQQEGKNQTEDDLAFLRDVWQYRNLLLVEQPNGDFAETIMRQFLFDAFHFYLLTALVDTFDKNVVSIAQKSLKEVEYHLTWSSEWVIRLGDGTDESHQRIQNSLNNLWEYTGEMFEANTTDKVLSEGELSIDLTAIKPLWEAKVAEVFKRATLRIPKKTWMQTGGKNGIHTEHLGYLLAEMQFLQRAYPNNEW